MLGRWIRRRGLLGARDYLSCLAIALGFRARCGGLRIEGVVGITEYDEQGGDGRG